VSGAGACAWANKRAELKTTVVKRKGLVTAQDFIPFPALLKPSPARPSKKAKIKGWRT
jgi:hypothetical protein